MVYIDFKFAYLVLTIPFLVAWTLLYIFGKRTRKEQLLMSLLILPLGSISELLYFKDYWIPTSILPLHLGSLPIFLEDFIFAFSIGGIGAVIYENLFKRKLIKTKVHKHVSLTLIVLIFGAVSILLFETGTNSIYATSVGFLIVALMILVQRRDLLLDSLFSGVAVMLTMFVSYFLLFNLASNIGELYQKIWLLNNSNLDYRLFNIPLTEMVWGFTWGMVAGPLYEYWKDLRFR